MVKMGGAQQSQKRGQRAGKGSHGSTTKAGKVRGQTPKIPPTNMRKSRVPRVSARQRYHRLIECEQEKGQDWSRLEKKREKRRN